MKKTVLIAASAIFSASLLASPAALAWDGVQVGSITRIDVTAGNNFGIRIMLGGVASMCSGGASWAYLNESDSNYKTYVAMLMLAKAQASKVTIFTTLESGYCHAGYIVVENAS